VPRILKMRGTSFHAVADYTRLVSVTQGLLRGKRYALQSRVMKKRDLNFSSLTIILFVLLLIVACDGAQTETPNLPEATLAPTRRPLTIPTTAAGWSAYSRSTFQIALPDTWHEVKLSDADLKRAITSAQENNPPLAEQLRALLESGRYNAFTFYAIENNDTGILRNVSIARVALKGANDLQAFAKSYAEQLPNVVRGSKVVELQRDLKVNGMNAAALVYDVSLVDQAGALTTLRGMQYIYLLDSGDAYLVTVTGDVNEGEKFLGLARQIATSFVGVTP